MLRVTSQDYEFQPIGAPFKKKLEPMPPRVRRESPPPERGLSPSEFDQPAFRDPLVDYTHIEQQLDIMRESLGRHLTANLQADPKAYFYKEKDIPQVIERFMNAFQNGQFVPDRSVKMMCKELGIKPTPRGVAQFIFATGLSGV